MSTIAHQTQSETLVDAAPRSLWRAAVGAGLVAAASTTVVAAGLHAAGVSLDVKDEPIPVLAFAQMTFLFSILGLGIAAGLRRWAARPRTAWLRTTIVLTALSFTPDLLADAAGATKALLMTTHLVAAVIVIPAVAGRLER